MEKRYTLIGFNITIISLIFVVLGYVIPNNVLLGVSLSLLVYGLTLVAVGLSLKIPVLESLYRYSSSSSLFYTRLLEDLGLQSSHIVYTCPDKHLVVYSKSLIECNNVLPGIGIWEDSPYIGIPFSIKGEEGGEETGTSDLSTSIYNLGFSRNVRTYTRDKNIVVELLGLYRESLNLLIGPVNPVRTTIVGTISRVIGRPVIVEREELHENSFVMEVRVLEEA